jgi:prevent-host-death family protein
MPYENGVLHPIGGCLFASNIAVTCCIRAFRVIRGSFPFSHLDLSKGVATALCRHSELTPLLSPDNFLAFILWSAHGHSMEMTITQFKAKCLGVVERVQREKVSVVISRHGHPAARLVPVDIVAGDARLFGRSENQTRISGDILSTGEAWDACR